MKNTEELASYLSGVLNDLRRAVDASVEIRSRGEEDAKNIAKIWESFLGGFIEHIRQKGKETGQNLLADISFMNIWRR